MMRPCSRRLHGKGLGLPFHTRGRGLKDKHQCTFPRSRDVYDGRGAACVEGRSELDVWWETYVASVSARTPTAGSLEAMTDPSDDDRRRETDDPPSWRRKLLVGVVIFTVGVVLSAVSAFANGGSVGEFGPLVALVGMLVVVWLLVMRPRR